jgi:hypothetical protein
MAQATDTIGFIGDFLDPWVAAIADALPASVVVKRLNCTGDIPEEPFGPAESPSLMVLHRHRLSALDRARIKRWSEHTDDKLKPIIVLCVSPYVRYEEIERVLGVVDQVLPEGTAADILPGRIDRYINGPLKRYPRVDGAHFAVEVSGRNEDLCRTLVDVCAKAGYRAGSIDDLLARDFARQPSAPSPRAERALTIWEVPVLEPEWPEVLARRALATGPVIGLLGFADRAAVSRAKASGATVCLDLPFEVDDLIDSVERAAGSRAPDQWPVPARMEPPHQLPPRPRRRAAPRETSSALAPWTEGKRIPVKDEG